MKRIQAGGEEISVYESGTAASSGRSSIARVVSPRPMGSAIVMIPSAGLLVLLSLNRSRFAQRRHFRAAISQQPGQHGFRILTQGRRRREVIGAAGLDGVAGGAVGAGDRMVDFHHHVAQLHLWVGQGLANVVDRAAGHIVLQQQLLPLGARLLS